MILARSFGGGGVVWGGHRHMCVVVPPSDMPLKYSRGKTHSQVGTEIPILISAWYVHVLKIPNFQ